MITYESLTDRIEKAGAEKKKTDPSSYLNHFWTGYIQGCRDIRNKINSK